MIFVYKYLFTFVIQDSDGGGGCPFCRAEIKGTESIVVDPFSPGGHHARAVAVSNGDHSVVGNLIDCDIEENQPSSTNSGDEQASMEVH